MTNEYKTINSWYDNINDDYILQKNYSGNKIRVSFNNNKNTVKSSFPELCDLKLTSFCDIGCRFCYQSSTKEGKHATMENLDRIVDILFQSNVMEVAIGGGEPTSSPYLLHTIRRVRSRNMIACFTTKNFNLHLHKDFKDLITTANSIAFSCNSVQEVAKVKTIMDAMREIRGNKARVYIQMIPELLSDQNFKDVLDYMAENLYGCPVTLLGYKDFGFGEKYEPKNRFTDATWIDTIKEYSNKHRMKFGIDSVLVSRFKQDLIDKEVDPKAMVGDEGKFSCYVDAVEMKIHKSSFSTDDGIKLTGEERNILEQFRTF